MHDAVSSAAHGDERAALGAAGRARGDGDGRSGMRELLVSVINYRTADMTIDCLRSLLDDMGDIDGEVVVVDNRSGDDSPDRIQAWIDAQPEGAPVRLIRSPENTGFSGGHNIGVAAGAARFYLIFNSDAMVRPGALKAMLARAHAEPGAGVIGTRLEWPDGRVQISCFRGFSPASELIRGADTGPVTALLRRWEVPLHDVPPRPEDIGWVSFASVLVRAETLRDVGGMDDGYFMYFEDADFCLRARRAGWGVVYEPGARVIHLRGGSAEVKSLGAARKRLPRYYYASRTRYLHAAHGHAGVLAANLAWHLGRAIARLRTLAGKSARQGVEREASDIWINSLDPRGDRFAPGS
jgi:N-acetylglucosaminyl-diphospho-decaprenol L-rhamnosyltransferase